MSDTEGIDKVDRWERKLRLLGCNVRLDKQEFLDGTKIIRLLELEINQNRLELPEGITEIVYDSLYGCTIKELVLPQSLVECNCNLPDSLEWCLIPAKLGTIKSSTFCSDITSKLKLEIQSDVKLDRYAIRYKNLYIKGSKNIISYCIAALAKTHIRTKLDTRRAIIYTRGIQYCKIDDLVVRLNGQIELGGIYKCTIGRITIECDTPEELAECTENKSDKLEELLYKKIEDSKIRGKKKYILKQDKDDTNV